MNRQLLTIALVGASAAYLYYATSVDEATDPSPDASAAPALADAAPANTRTAIPEPQPDLALDDNTEIVHGMRVRKDRNCDVEIRQFVTLDGEMRSGYACTPREPAPLHPYAHYDNDALAVLAWSDAQAARLLGQRLIGNDTPRAYELLIRASALDNGNPAHIVFLAEQAFGSLTIDGEPQVANLERHYELAVLAERLGDSTGKAEYLRELLSNGGADAERFKALDQRADDRFEAMLDIQRTVIGEANLGGPGDA